MRNEMHLDDWWWSVFFWYSMYLLKESKRANDPSSFMTTLPVPSMALSMTAVGSDRGAWNPIMPAIMTKNPMQTRKSVRAHHFLGEGVPPLEASEMVWYCAFDAEDVLPFWYEDMMMVMSLQMTKRRMNERSGTDDYWQKVRSNSRELWILE